MSEYRVEVSATAEKQLRRLDKTDQGRIVRAIKALSREPRPRSCRPMRGYDDVFRLRVGHFRILYSIEYSRLLIIGLKVGHRKDVYRQGISL